MIKLYSPRPPGLRYKSCIQSFPFFKEATIQKLLDAIQSVGNGLCPPGNAYYRCAFFDPFANADGPTCGFSETGFVFFNERQENSWKLYKGGDIAATLAHEFIMVSILHSVLVML